MENLFIRRMVFDDIETVKIIYGDAFNKKVCKAVDYTKEDIYVVCHFDKVIGMCMVNYIDDIFIDRRTALVNGVCVDKEYRGKGIGTFLLTKIEEIAIEDGSDEIMLTSSEKRVCANKLYEKLGFRVYDTNVYKKKI